MAPVPALGPARRRGRRRGALALLCCRAAAAAPGHAEGTCASGGGGGPEACGGAGDAGWSPQTLSVVLPCAGEGVFALNTVRAVSESTPAAALHEIVVVDDGSEPPLGDSFLDPAVRQKFNVKLIRHERAAGLIVSKKRGGDAASGDVVVFFDCHVAPQPGWHVPFLRLLSENYRRIVVPVITDLDVGSWQQKPGGARVAKCYLTWDADFKWFESDDPYVPVLSGGLLAISRQWWAETGGYDERMTGWGGENVDQSLRTWLCGGEIVLAEDAVVAHMWRDPSDPRTAARYAVDVRAAFINRLRAALAWFGEFSEKLPQFPAFEYLLGANDSAGAPLQGDLENVLSVKRSLGCRPLAWFLHRFRHIYEDGGLLPPETFAIEAAGTGQCLTYAGPAGTSPDGRGTASLEPCRPGDHRQRWHGANRDASQAQGPCCSGVRAWNTDQCIAGSWWWQGAVATATCDVSGGSSEQLWQLGADGHLRAGGARSLWGETCLRHGVGARAVAIRPWRCPPAGGGPGDWALRLPEQPAESRLYREALPLLEAASSAG